MSYQCDRCGHRFKTEYEYERARSEGCPFCDSKEIYEEPTGNTHLWDMGW